VSSVQTILLLVTAATVVLCPTTSLWAQPVTQPHVEQRDDGLESKLVGSQRGAGNGESEWKAWLQMLLALAVVVAMIFGLRWLLKRLSGGTMGGGRAGVLEVVARTGVTTKQELMLVRLGERLVLLGRSPGAMARLAEVTDAKEVQRLRAMIDGRGEEIEKKGGEV
jgi:flagellar biogenesis protein FliO